MEGATPDSDEVFAEWYVWAKREVTSDPRVCLGVAQAAVEAQAAGADRPAAEAAARRSVAGVAVTLMAKVSPWRRGYAQWYDWARLEFGGEPDRLHRLTRIAIQRLKSDGDAAQAAEVARSAAAADPPPGADAPGGSGSGSSWTQGGPAAPGGWGGGQSSAGTPPFGMGPAPAAGSPGGPPPFGAGQSLPSGPSLPVTLERAAYAGLGLRLGAAAIDAIVVVLGAALVFVVGAIFYLIAVISTREASGYQEFLTAVALLVMFGVIYWLYDAGLESSPGRATPGKRAMGLVVIDKRGRPVSFGRATARHFVKFVPLILCVLPLYLSGSALVAGFVDVVTLGLGLVGVIFAVVLVVEFLLAAWTPRKQGLHDLIAGTLVVRRDWLSRAAPATSSAPPPPPALPEPHPGVPAGVPRGGEAVPRGG